MRLGNRGVALLKATYSCLTGHLDSISLEYRENTTTILALLVIHRLYVWFGIGHRGAPLAFLENNIRGKCRPISPQHASIAAAAAEAAAAAPRKAFLLRVCQGQEKFIETPGAGICALYLMNPLMPESVHGCCRRKIFQGWFPFCVY